MKIIQFRAENVKRLRAVEITPSGDVIIVGGKNRAGKTSVLDAIMMALGGARTMCETPIRKGTKQAEIEIDLGELVVKRVITKKGTTLKVTGKDGKALASPQAVLDKLSGTLTFDPLEFTRLSPKAQLDTLKSVAGLDFSELTAKHDALFTKRTEVNRDVVQAASLRDGTDHYEDAPDELVQVQELGAQLEKNRAINLAKREAIDKARVMASGVNTTRSRVAASTLAIAVLEKTVADTRADLQDRIAQVEKEAEVRSASLHAAYNTAVGDVSKYEAEWKEAKDAADSMIEADETEIVQQISAASEINHKVEANRRHEEAAACARELRKQSDQLSREIEAVDEAKVKALADAKLPVKGLGLDEEQVLLSGLPFSQASSAEQLHASVAIAAAMNPELKIMLIRDGSLMDKDSLQLLCELSTKHECQVWIERVGEGEECQVIIEDGGVKEPKSDA